MSAQGEAIDKAAEIMGEHFAGFLIVGLEQLGDDRNSPEGIRLEIGGGQHTAIGLAARASSILLSEANRTPEEES